MYDDACFGQDTVCSVPNNDQLRYFKALHFADLENVKHRNYRYRQIDTAMLVECDYCALLHLGSNGWMRS